MKQEALKIIDEIKNLLCNNAMEITNSANKEVEHQAAIVWLEVKELQRLIKEKL